MKPYGREKKLRFPQKRDYKMFDIKGRRLENWWEDTCGELSRSVLRMMWKKEVKEELNEKYSI